MTDLAPIPAGDIYENVDNYNTLVDEIKQTKGRRAAFQIRRVVFKLARDLKRIANQNRNTPINNTIRDRRYESF